jgi:hypothetical protein
MFMFFSCLLKEHLSVVPVCLSQYSKIWSGDVAVAADASQLAAPNSGQVGGEVGVVLCGGVEQDIKTRQLCREPARVGTGVVNAVGEQRHPGVSCRDAVQLSPGGLEWEGDVGEPAGGDPQQCRKSALRFDGIADMGEHGGI